MYVGMYATGCVCCTVHMCEIRVLSIHWNTCGLFKLNNGFTHQGLWYKLELNQYTYCKR